MCMCTKSYQKVSVRYIDVLEALGFYKEETPHYPTACGHLLWMLYQIRYGAVGSDTKSHRWLGYVQGVLTAKGFISVEVEREETRDIFKGE